MNANPISEFNRYVTGSASFTVTGLTGFLRLFLVNLLAGSRKVLFITSTEQTALRYQHDLSSYFGLKAELFPYQNSSMYDVVSPNRFDYAKQV